MKVILLVGFLLLALQARAAAPVDLGQGLLYCRAQALPRDLPTAEPGKKSALVLDLRYLTADENGTAAFSAWLGFRSPSDPVFILVNAGTAPALLHVLAAHPRQPGIVTLGPPLPGFTPDVPLKISPDTDRRAYDALEHGAPVESLIVEKIDKPRYDEATLVKDHASDSAPPPEEDAGGEDQPAAKKPAPPPQLIDLELRRAVQLDRALLALRKIPRG